MLNPDGINEGNTINDLIKTVKEVARMNLRDELKKLGFQEYFKTTQSSTTTNYTVSLHVKEDKIVLLRETWVFSTEARQEDIYIPLTPSAPRFPEEEQLKALKKYLEE